MLQTRFSRFGKCSNIKRESLNVEKVKCRLRRVSTGNITRCGSNFCSSEVHTDLQLPVHTFQRIGGLNRNSSNPFHTFLCDQQSIRVVSSVEGIYNLSLLWVQWSIHAFDSLPKLNNLIFLHEAVEDITAHLFPINDELVFLGVNALDKISAAVGTIGLAENPLFNFVGLLAKDYSALHNCYAGIIGYYHTASPGKYGFSNYALNRGRVLLFQLSALTSLSLCYCCKCYKCSSLLTFQVTDLSTKSITF